MSDIYRFGEFSLELGGRRLLRNGERVSIRSKAFDTLAALVVRAGMTVEKEELLKEVWPGTFVSDETLAQNISTLRRVLGDDAESPRYIATVPRRGYRFVMRVVQEEAAPVPAVGHVLAEGPKISSSRRRLAIWLVGVFLTGGVLAAVVVLALTERRSPPGGAPVRFVIAAPQGTQLSTSGGGFAISPDGSSLIFVASGSGGDDHLWLRPLGDTTAHVLPGTEGASQPFWSGDSRFVAFFSHDHLNAIEIGSGVVRSICRSPAPNSVAGSWSGHGDILFGAIKSGLFRVRSSGGSAEPVTVSGCARCALWPQFLPDDRHFLYTAYAPDRPNAGVFVGSLDSNESRRILSTPSSTLFVEPGHLLYIEHGGLMARGFDSRRLELTGEAQEIAQEVSWNVYTGRGAFSASQSGVIVFRPVIPTRLTWFSRAGGSLGVVGPAGQYDSFSISPDGRHVAAALLDPRLGTCDLWTFSADGSDATRLTFDPGSEVAPMWTADGREVIYSGESEGTWRVFSTDASRSGVSRTIDEVSRSPSFAVPLGRNREGVVLFTPGQSRSGEYWIIRGAGASRGTWPAGIIHGAVARVSPDGRWLAYVEPDVDSRGQHHPMYVRALPPAEGRWEIAEEGNEPRWRIDSRELYFLGADLAVRSVTIDTADSAVVGRPQVVLRPAIVAPSGLIGQAYDISPDGKSVLAKVPLSQPVLVVSINWSAR